MSGSYSSEQKSILTEEQLHGISKYWKVYLCYPFFFFHNLWATSETASGILTNRPLAILLGCITVKTTYLGWHWALHTCKLLDSWVLVFSTRGHHHTHQLCLQTGMQRSLENAVLHTSIFSHTSHQPPLSIFRSATSHLKQHSFRTYHDSNHIRITIYIIISEAVHFQSELLSVGSDSWEHEIKEMNGREMQSCETNVRRKALITLGLTALRSSLIRVSVLSSGNAICAGMDTWMPSCGPVRDTSCTKFITSGPLFLV